MHGTGGPLTGVWLLTGGARAGKSAFAERLAGRSDRPVVVIATAEPFDEDMVARIARHRLTRPTHWTTIEAPIELGDAVAGQPDDACIIIDCVTVWAANLFHHDGNDAGPRIEAHAEHMARCVARRRGPSIVVTNEVGLGVVPDNPLGRRYRDTLGRVNASLASVADRVILLSAGRAVELSPLEDLC